MPKREPEEIDRREAARRRRRIARMARSFGFRGHVEYRHVYSQSGGAQYCIGPTPEDDVLVIYAEAFERDRDPHDFSLPAMIAHECGHQRLTRDRELADLGRRLSGTIYEEVLASLVGSLLADGEDSRQLVWKAMVDLSMSGLSAEKIVRTIEELRALLKEMVG
jgi:hypothetical protein